MSANRQQVHGRRSASRSDCYEGAPAVVWWLGQQLAPLPACQSTNFHPSQDGCRNYPGIACGSYELLTHATFFLAFAPVPYTCQRTERESGSVILQRSLFYFTELHITAFYRVIKKSLCTWLSVFEQSPHNWWFEDGHHRKHSECGLCYIEHGLWQHSSLCQ